MTLKTNLKLAYRQLPPIIKETRLTEVQINGLIQEWENMPAHQIGDLEPGDIYLNILPQVLEWINQETRPA